LVAATTSSSNVDFVKSLGADVVVDYKKDNFEKKLRDYDAVLNSLDAQTLRKSLNVLKPGGKLISISGPPDPGFAREMGLNWGVRQVMRLLSYRIRKAAERRRVSSSFLFMKASGDQFHDRDSIFARHLDDSIRALGLAALRSPFSSPKANAICERVIGTIRRECLDWMIPMSEAHLRSILREWVTHYNGGRPHSALGPGTPGPPAGSARTSKAEPRRLWTPGALVRATSVLGGLHHEYSLSWTPVGA
jgi:hypothetical protein